MAKNPTELEKICKEMDIPYDHLNSGEFEELMEEMKKRLGLKSLKCPECGEGVLNVQEAPDFDIVVFNCMFSATFDKGITAEDAQKRLNEFKASGRMEEWLRKPLF